MILYEERADIFKSGFQTLVNPVNTYGTMGAGLAKKFARRFPGLETVYKQAINRNVFVRKGIFVFDVPDSEKKVVCLATKRHFSQPSKLEWIDEGLRVLARDFSLYGITSLAVPALGCGLGQLQWEDVRPLILRHLEPIDLPVGIFSP
jgi:O-acetyl-ADP-ribose deacetylase (regulator of RNase III)